MPPTLVFYLHILFQPTGLRLEGVWKRDLGAFRFFWQEDRRIWIRITAVQSGSIIYQQVFGLFLTREGENIVTWL